MCLCYSLRYDGTAVDVWSMGVMLYYMLRGKFPFPDFNGKGSMEILRRIPSSVKSDLLVSEDLEFPFPPPPPLSFFDL